MSLGCKVARLAARRGRRRARGFSMAESLVSVILVSGVLVASINTVGSVMMGRSAVADRGQGELLAASLMSEILEKHFAERDSAIEFGAESPEVDGDRSTFDDVDDYNGWQESPPVMLDGTALADRSWARTVTVQYVDGTSEQVKLVVVTVFENGSTVAQLYGMRGNGDDMAFLANGSPSQEGITYETTTFKLRTSEELAEADPSK